MTRYQSKKGSHIVLRLLAMICGTSLLAGIALAVPGKGNGNGNGNSGNGRGNAHSHGHRQSRSKDGTYSIVVAGAFNGAGQASVTADSVTLRGTLSTADGRQGPLVANNLSIDGPYFSGQGTLLGEAVTIRGRLDAARASRLTATIFTQTCRSARLAGTLPATADQPDDPWDD